MPRPLFSREVLLKPLQLANIWRGNRADVIAQLHYFAWFVNGPLR
jgi:hypothetical protein